MIWGLCRTAIHTATHTTTRTATRTAGRTATHTAVHWQGLFFRFKPLPLALQHTLHHTLQRALQRRGCVPLALKSCHVLHVTCFMSHMDELCMSHVTRERFTSHMLESRHICMSHVTFE